MSNLAEFLLARIAEDERLARDAEATWSQVRIHYGTSANQEQRFAREAFVLNINPWRILRECEAKRRIVERLVRAGDVAWSGSYAVREDARASLADLALPYADHPDYDPEWRI